MLYGDRRCLRCGARLPFFVRSRVLFLLKGLTLMVEASIRRELEDD